MVVQELQRVIEQESLRNGLSLGRIVLELTEQAAIPEGTDVADRIAALQRLGLQFAFDDVGIDLVTALLAYFGHEETAPLAARFVPIVAGSARDSNESAELKILGARYPGLVLPPIYQDASGGLILQSPEARHHGCDLEWH